MDVRTRRDCCAERGFTVIELMMAVAVVTILAAIALPSYSAYVTRGKLSEAFGILTSYSLTLAQYYQDSRSYLNACTAVGVPSSSNFTYSCPTQTATAFLVQAQGNPGTPVAGFTFTIDNGGVRATTAAPAGWSTSASCWVSSKSGTCQ